MKNLRFALIVTLIFSSANVAFAQGRFGVDSVDCVKNLSFYRDYHQQNNFKDAHPFWALAMKFCPPTASHNFYTQGVQIMTYMIEHTTDPELRQRRIDTLLMLYDIRMANFKVDKGVVYANKAYEVLKYKPENTEAVYEAFYKAVMAGGENATPHAMITTMQKAVELFQAEKFSADKLLELYSKISDFAEKQMKVNALDEQIRRACHDLESIFCTSGAATCCNLVAMLKPAFEANPQDKDLVIRVVKLLSMNDCTANDLYYKAVEAYHTLDPSPGSAYGLARMYHAKGETSRAIQYYREAIAHPDTPPFDKTRYCLELATVYMRDLHSPTQAATFARQAIATSPNDGRGYMLMGNIWAALHGKCGDDEISKKAMFWVSVDYFNRAKSMDSSLAEEANKFINSHTQHFPLQQDIFMYDLTEGEVYTVTCSGLTEQTRVRARK